MFHQVYKLSFSSYLSREEETWVEMYALSRGFLYLPGFVSPKLIAYTTFVAFVQMYGTLDIVLCFVALSFASVLRGPLTAYIPYAVSMISEVSVTLSRIQVPIMYIGVVTKVAHRYQGGTVVHAVD